LNEPMVRTAPATIDAADFFERAHARLRFDVPPALHDPDIVPTSGDAGTDRMLEIVAREQPIRPAAVLIPVVARPEPTVLLTLRASHLNDHAGQIAFPGGKIDPADASPRDAALREAFEEVGLDRGFIDPIGISTFMAPRSAIASCRRWPVCRPASSSRSAATRSTTPSRCRSPS